MDAGGGETIVAEMAGDGWDGATGGEVDEWHDVCKEVSEACEGFEFDVGGAATEVLREVPAVGGSGVLLDGVEVWCGVAAGEGVPARDDAGVEEGFVHNENNVDVGVGEARAGGVFYVGNALVVGYDVGDCLSAVTLWSEDAHGVEVIDESDNEAVAIVVFVLVPGYEVGVEKFVALIVEALVVADEVGTSDEKGSTDSNHEGSSDETGFFGEAVDEEAAAEIALDGDGERNDDEDGGDEADEV